MKFLNRIDATSQKIINVSDPTANQDAATKKYVDDSISGSNPTPYAEIPTGTINSTNKVFTLTNTPASTAGVIVILDGVVQYNGSDYTVSGTTITFVTAPDTGSTIFAYYNTLYAGGSRALQTSLASNKIGRWNPPGNAATLPGVDGYTAPTAVGTVTARTTATTNMFTRTKRLGFVSAATAGSLASLRVAVAQVTTSNGSVGGFLKVIRFGISDAAVVSGARMFVGMSTSILAPTNVEPSTLLNSIGVGHGASDTNLKIFYGGSAAQTPINLGVNFPSNTTNIDLYELTLYAPPAASGEIQYKVVRLNTGDTASGTILPASGVALPLYTSLMAYQWVYRTNNATATAVGLDIISDYIETST